MQRTRRLSIVRNIRKRGLYMKVAFASTDKIHVNEHFGRAQEFYIWDVAADDASLNGVVQVKQEGNDEAERIEARCSGVADCSLVYVAQIGGPAAARLVQKKVHPIKIKDEATITETVEKLQEVLRNNPPPWLRKAMMKGERPSFADR
ncbi:Dinitrogenase iron-molybdenum cofactor biosynthesis [Desulfuromonas acetoxidans DSM 684]|uniref:Dinitrogenase iron-molybdenum cofactor biosynthesis n=2 Tax=Desulfuromonas acetoxidans TaxID=891 RepID=Q1K0I9_DESA6|nr:Dinitrogenase iron-molybdenum cofactor biosynthesis [Desulfuromonas acetoxidans DSM 684]